MTYTQPVQQFWAFVITYAIGSGVMSAMIVYLFGGWAALLGLLLLAGSLGLLSLVGQGLFVPHRIPAWQVQPIVVAELWPNYDRSWLEIYTQSLVDLGFQPLQDYTHSRSDGRSASAIKSIVRCFYHPVYGSLAEVGFGFNPAGEARVSHTVFFSIFEQGWMLIDFNRSPHRRESLIYAWRNPREVRRYYPQFTIEDVFGLHQQTCEEMTERLQVAVVPQDSWAMYQAIQRELVARPWKRLRRRNLFVAMWEATQFERFPKYEWWGDYDQARVSRIPAIKT
jgi:hypothetical protein